MHYSCQRLFGSISHTPCKPHPARALDLSIQLISNMDIHEACAPFSACAILAGERNEIIAEARTWPFCWQSHRVWVQVQAAKLLVSRDDCQIATSMSGWLKAGITPSAVRRSEGGMGCEATSQAHSVRSFRLSHSAFEVAEFALLPVYHLYTLQTHSVLLSVAGMYRNFYNLQTHNLLSRLPVYY